MTREISPEGLQYLTAREGGLRLDVHDDGFGFPTVGVGHLVLDEDGLEIGDLISEDRAMDFLQIDTEEACEAVERYVSIDLSLNQFDALAIFCYNIGVGAFKRSTLVRRLNIGDDPDTVVREELPRWNKVSGRFVRGIANRRIDTVQMFVDADYTVDWSGLEGQT